jgi:tetratricopeptide (TPR) repeat protein
MNKSFKILVIVATLAAFCVPPAWSQMAKLKGKVADNGVPIAGATVEFTDVSSGRKYTFTTDKRGEYSSIGMNPATYNVTVTKDKNVLTTVAGFVIQARSSENVLELDITRDKAKALAGMSEEEKKKREEIAAENKKIGSVNALLAQASDLQQQGNYDGAADTMRQAAEAAPNMGLVWARYGDAELLAAKKSPDKAAAQEKVKLAVEAFNKALAAPTSGPGSLKPEDLAIVLTNSAEASARAGMNKEALDTCERITTIPTANAGRCYFNVGAVFTNMGKVDDANTAFDKAIAADPTQAEAYYQKGVNLLGKATVDPDGKMNAPPEVAQNLNKYLELAPTGPNAQAAKDMLASLGAKVETSFGSAKKAAATPKKK